MFDRDQHLKDMFDAAVAKVAAGEPASLKSLVDASFDPGVGEWCRQQHGYNLHKAVMKAVERRFPT